MSRVTARGEEVTRGDCPPCYSFSLDLSLLLEKALFFVSNNTLSMLISTEEESLN